MTPDSGIDRRRFLGLAAAGLLGTRCSSEPEAPLEEAGAPFEAPLGVNLYTVRRVLPEMPQEILQAIADLGYVKVEMMSWDFERYAGALSEAGLQVASLMFPSAVITGQWDAYKALAEQAGMELPKAKPTIEDMAGMAKQAGVGYLVVPYMAEAERGENLDDYRAFADKLNAAGEVCNKAGVRLAYHNHAFEFGPLEDSSPFEAIISSLDPDKAAIELDVFWASVGGQDPVKILEHHPQAVRLMHLKDKAADQEVQYNEEVPPDSFKAAGKGSIDFAAVLRQAEENGVEHYFVEQDETPGHPVDSLRESYQHLRSLRI